MSYYNTTKEIDTAKPEKKAKRQEKKVLFLFKEHQKLSCSQVFNLYNCKDTPLTSIRRAVTVLSNFNMIVKTKEKIKGFYGRNECVYEFQNK